MAGDATGSPSPRRGAPAAALPPRRGRFRRRKYFVLLAVAVLGASWVGADTIARRRQTRGWTPVARLDLVRDQGGVGYSARHRMFVVVHGDEVLALSAISPHSLTAPEPVLFCPSSGYFEATQHGEKFDRRGVYVAGPAPRGLDRFPVMTYGGLVYSKPGRLQPGPPRGTEALPREGPFCSTPDTARSGFFRPAG